MKNFWNFTSCLSTVLWKLICVTAILLSEDQLCYASYSYLSDDAYQHLYQIQDKVVLKHGNKKEELPEQLMVANFLNPDAKVLEFGADVGRNSCLIATILNDSSNLVVVEPRREAIPYLNENRNINNLKFHIETSAISKVPLIQKGWITIPSDILLPGYTRISTITYDELMVKYAIDFDTLVIDCEGAFYYILKDQPDILKNIKLIIIENDFQCGEHCKYVSDKFKENGLEILHNEGPPYWYNNSFYQVWIKLGQ